MTVIEPLRVDDDEVLAADPDLAGDRRRGQWMIAGDDDDPDPCAVTAGDRLADLGAGRVEHRDQTEEAQLTLGLLARGDRCAGWQGPPGERQHAQPVLRVCLDAMHDALTLRRVERELPGVPGEDRDAAGQDLFRSALGVKPLAPGSKLERRH